MQAERAGPRAEPLAAAFERLATGIGALVRGHLELARAELGEGLRAVGQNAGAVAIGAVALLCGYLSLMAALGMLLTTWVPPWCAFGCIALANGVPGAIVLARGLSRATGAVRRSTAMARPEIRGSSPTSSAEPGSS